MAGTEIENFNHIQSYEANNIQHQKEGSKVQGTNQNVQKSIVSTMVLLPRKTNQQKQRNQTRNFEKEAETTRTKNHNIAEKISNWQKSRFVKKTRNLPKRNLAVKTRNLPK